MGKIKALFKRKAPVIILDEGLLSSKIVLLGTMGKDRSIGCLRVCKYKDNRLHEYGEEITDELIGDPLVTILFGSADGIKKLSDGLYNLYRVITEEEDEDVEV